MLFLKLPERISYRSLPVAGGLKRYRTRRIWRNAHNFGERQVASTSACGVGQVRGCVRGNGDKKLMGR